MEQLFENTNLKPSTKKKYISSLKTTAKTFNITDLKDFTDPSLIDKILQKWENPNTLLSRLNPIKYIYKHFNLEDTLLLNAISSLDFKKTVEEPPEWETLLEIYNSAKPTKTLMYLIFSFYFLFGPRRISEFAKLKVVDSLEEAIEGNFIVQNKWFVFDDYKTHKTYGKQTFKLNKKLTRILNKFTKEQIEQIDEDIIKTTLDNYLKTNSREIRRSYETHVWNNYKKSGDKKMIEQSSYLLAHSIETAFHSYVH